MFARTSEFKGVVLCVNMEFYKHHLAYKTTTCFENEWAILENMLTMTIWGWHGVDTIDNVTKFQTKSTEGERSRRNPFFGDLYQANIGYSIFWCNCWFGKRVEDDLLKNNNQTTGRHYQFEMYLVSCLKEKLDLGWWLWERSNERLDKKSWYLKLLLKLWSFC